MIPVLRKVVQLNIKYRKNRSPIIDVCTGTPPDEVMALGNAFKKQSFVNFCFEILITFFNYLKKFKLYLMLRQISQDVNCCLKKL